MRQVDTVVLVILVLATVASIKLAPMAFGPLLATIVRYRKATR